MANFQPATKLSDRSYIGLVLSQFLAAFNDQAIHVAAIFYASDMLHGYVGSGFDQKAIVSVVTACFISPFFLFSPLAGILADKYSKQKTIVFWKVAEIAITGLALFGFLLPHWSSPEAMKSTAQISAWLLILAVFLMGTHSAFFVPAKYGIMPEILHGSVLSRGNGLLEGTSFVSNILGTSFGGFMYFYTKSKIDPTAPGGLILGNEWIIGAVLFVLAFIGTAFSMLVAKIPAAAPDRVFTFNPLVPLAKNFGELKRSRPLVLATIGIAFFTFMTLFVRQTLFLQGESTKELNAAKTLQATQQKANSTDQGTAALAKPESHQLDELWISTLVALVGFGVGAGCAMAGKLSGSRLELGLVPIGILGLITLTGLLSFVAEPAQGLSGDGSLLTLVLSTAAQQLPTIICLVAIGFAAGLYIVPLYTLLQHRAPKDSKGNMVATSNFVNVTGGLIAIGMFYGVTYLFQSIRGNEYTRNSVGKLTEYIAQLERHQSIPQMLFLFAAGMTVVMLFVFLRLRPDFFLRTLSYLKQSSRRSLQAIHADHVPSYGPLLVVSNARTLNDWIKIISVIDRKLNFAWIQSSEDDATLSKWTQRMQVGLRLPDDSLNSGPQLLSRARQVLESGNLFGVSLPDGENSTTWTSLTQELQRYEPQLIPVCVDIAGGSLPVSRVIVGQPVAYGIALTDLQAQLQQLAKTPYSAAASGH
jgi:MFS family permease